MNKLKWFILPVLMIVSFVLITKPANAFSYEVSTNIYTGTVNVDDDYEITYDLATFVNITGRQVIEQLFGMIGDPSEVATAIYDMPLSSVYVSTTEEYLTYTNVELMIIKVYTSSPLYLLNVDINLFDDTGYKIVTKTYANGLPQGFQLLAQSYGPNEPFGSYQRGYDDGLEFGLDNSLQYDLGYADGYDLGLSNGSEIMSNVQSLFEGVLSSIGNVFSTTIFPGVTIGTLFMIPISFAMFKWFLKLIK